MATINGTSDDDTTLSGSVKNDSINGLDGNDELYGDSGADVLNGGIGNDYLQGDAGADTYLIGGADGLDWINNYDTDTSVDTVKFTGLTAGGVTAVFEDWNTDNLVLQYGGGSQLTIQDYFSGDANYRVDKLQFTDAAWTLANIAQQHSGTTYDETLNAFDGMANTLNGLAGDDTLNGGNGADTLNGGEGEDGLTGNAGNDVLNGGADDDTLYGSLGNDVLNGGIGDDYLIGDAGADTYLIGSADGLDWINNYDTDTGIDTVKFTDLAASGVTAVFQDFSTSNLVLRYGSGSELTIGDYFNDANYRVDKFQFTDTAWTLANIAQQHSGTAYSETLNAFDGMANTLNGLDGDDTLNGGSGADTLNGGAGNDTLSADLGNDVLNGGTGNDRLYGDLGNDVLAGGAGNDYLQGDNGADTYLIGSADGLDWINNYDTDTSVDTVKFTDLAAGGVTAVFQAWNTNDLVLQYGGGSQLTVQNYFNDANARVDKFLFTDTTWTLANIAQQHSGTAYSETLYAFDGMANTLNGLAGGDTLNGGNNADTLNGGAGNDPLYGGLGNDLLTGGTGNDYLRGDNGSDTYQFSKGDGKDEINNYDNDSKADLVVFTDVASTEITALFQQYNTNNLVVQYAGGQITVDSYFYGDANYRVDKFQFTDTSWTLANIAQLHNGTSYSETLYAFDGMANTVNGLAGKDTLAGGTGNDNLNGGSGNDSLAGNDGKDTLTGGTGNDSLSGGAGTDTYLFSQADGQDEIYNYDTDGSTDIVRFTDMASTDITAVTTVIDTEHLLIQYGNNSSLTIDYYFDSNASYRVDQFQFTDGVNVGNFLVGGADRDTLTGGNGNDVLSGLGNADKLIGGSGSDLYFVDNGGDVVVEAVGVAGDVDTVKSSVNYPLANNVENLTLTGTAALNGTGNTLNNLMVGNSGNNVLDGGAGADTLKGGAGADTFVLGTVAGGADSIVDFVSATDHLKLADGALAIGNGDHVINNGISTNASHFTTAAELVVINSAIVGVISASSAATAIGSATSAYSVGDTRLFTVNNGVNSALYLFDAADNNAQVDATELTLVGTLQGTAQTALADYMFA
jgi:Ca2+-binding RTX toxin-like protein